MTVAGDVLRDLTVVTPGANDVLWRAGGPAYSVADDGWPAFAAPEFVMFVHTLSVRPDDVAVFRSMAARMSSSPVSSLLIFNKADLLGGSGVDPWPIARQVADQQAHLLWQVVPDVVPIAALLAETADADRLTPADHDALRRLATIPAVERVVLLAASELFINRETVVTREARERLLKMLNLPGAALALDLYVQQPRLAPGELVRRLRQVSGWPRLPQTIDRVLRRRADAIKADRALSSLEEIASRAGNPVDRDLIGDAVEAGLRLPELRRLRWLTTIATTTGDECPPDELVRQIRQAYVAEPGPATDDQFQTLTQEFARWRQRIA